MKTLIQNGIIIKENELLYDHSIVLEKDRIIDIVKSNKVDSNKYEEIIDLKGKYISPGFIDIHTHGAMGFDILDATDEAIDNISKYHIKNGVTSYIGTIITSSKENIIKAIKNIVNYKHKINSSQIIGIHLEGPFFNLEKKGAQPSEYITLPNKDLIVEIIKKSKDKLKIVSLAPELNGALNIINILKNNNIHVGIAHSNASASETKEAIDSGVTIVNHLYNGMRAFSHREPGIIGASLTDDRVYCEIIYDRIHVHDLAVSLALKSKGLDKVILVSDSMMAAGLNDGKYLIGNQKVIVKNNEPRLLSGGLAGSTLNLKTAIENIISHQKLNIREAINLASINPARALELDSEIGSIEIGKKADLLIFDYINNKILIKDIILNGRRIY